MALIKKVCLMRNWWDIQLRRLNKIRTSCLGMEKNWIRSLVNYSTGSNSKMILHQSKSSLQRDLCKSWRKRLAQKSRDQGRTVTRAMLSLSGLTILGKILRLRDMHFKVFIRRSTQKCSKIGSNLINKQLAKCKLQIDCCKRRTRSWKIIKLVIVLS